MGPYDPPPPPPKPEPPPSRRLKESEQPPGEAIYFVGDIKLRCEMPEYRARPFVWDRKMHVLAGLSVDESGLTWDDIKRFAAFWLGPWPPPPEGPPPQRETELLIALWLREAWWLPFALAVAFLVAVTA